MSRENGHRQSCGFSARGGAADVKFLSGASEPGLSISGLSCPRWPPIHKKNPALASSGVCLETGNLFFLVLALGGLERIDFGTPLHGGRTDVRGHIAVADLPFERRIGTGRTIPAGLDFHFTAAAVALFHDLMANPAVIRTALCGHEWALSAFSNGCTNHWNHPL
jgi:hypothetical protein